MMTPKDGYIKYQCNWVKSQPPDAFLIEELNNWRAKCHTLGLIGVYPNGIGYGNISIRLNDRHFLITGSATGHLSELSANHYTTVTDYHFGENRLTCEGPIQASSESLTHAAIYEADKAVNAVIHIHSKNMWNVLMNKIPTTSPKVEYGTPQMAMEILRLFQETDLMTKKILVMGGHEEGILSFGKTLDEAGGLLMSVR
jgi:L-ribulose-5-phosphate 4-epimerase